MAKLIFDIETSALPLEQFDAVQQEYLFREAENMPDPAARAARREEIHRQFSLWPLTGQVVCIAMLNADSSGAKCCSWRMMGPTHRGGSGSGGIRAVRR